MDIIEFHSYSQKGEIELCLKKIDAEIDPIDNLSHELVNLEILKAKLLHDLNEIEELSQFTSRIKEHSESLDYKLAKIAGDVFKAFLYRRENRIKAGMDLTLQTLQELDEVENNEIMTNMLKMVVLNARGLMFWGRGKLDEAMVLFERSLALRRKHNYPLDIARALNNIAIIEFSYGDLTSSLKTHQESLKIKRDLARIDEIAISLANIGEIYRHLGKFEESRKYLLESLDLKEKTSTDHSISFTVYELFQTSYSTDNREEMKKWLDRLEQLSATNPTNITIWGHYNVAFALYKKSLPRSKHKIMAQEVFKKVVHEEKLDFSIKSYAMINLCDLFIDEFSFFESEDVLDNIVEMSTRIEQMARDQYSYTLQVESLIIRAKFNLVDENINRAIDLLQQAKTITEEQNLSMLKEKVVREQMDLEEKLQNWQKIIDQSTPVMQRLEESNLKDYLSMLIKDFKS